jgi:hypothetical protein
MLTPDFSRRTPVVDPDDHHLFVSLGCATETALIAAAAHGRPGAVAFDGSGDGAIPIDLARGPTDAGDLYQAIPLRQTTRSEYDGQPISTSEVNRLDAASAIDGVSVTFITDAARRDAETDFVLRGNRAQIGDPAYVRELRDWLRFNKAAALETRDGLFSACSGNPTLPTWIGKRMFGWFFTVEAENKKAAKQLKSSAGIAVFAGERADKDHWIRVGRSLQRFALQAAALDIRHAYLNQPVEVPSLRSEFADWLGLGELRPDLVVRFGRAPAMPMSLRRPVADVIVRRHQAEDR